MKFGGVQEKLDYGSTIYLGIATCGITIASTILLAKKSHIGIEFTRAAFLSGLIFCIFSLVHLYALYHNSKEHDSHNKSNNKDNPKKLYCFELSLCIVNTALLVTYMCISRSADVLNHGRMNTAIIVLLSLSAIGIFCESLLQVKSLVTMVQEKKQQNMNNQL